MINEAQSVPMICDLSLQYNNLQRQANDLIFQRRQFETDGLKNRDELKRLKFEIDAITTEKNKVKKELYEKALKLPNITHPASPVGLDPSVYMELNLESIHPADTARDHNKILLQKGLIDIQSAAQVSGNSFYYLKGPLVRLEQALIQFALDKAHKKGWEAFSPPNIVRLEVAQACGYSPRDQQGDQIYMLKSSNISGESDELAINEPVLCLAGTAEIPLAGMYMNQVIDSTNLPIRAVGLSRCFRAEAGARGKESAGLYRVHEFNKVELFCWSLPNHSEEILDEMLNFQIETISELGLPAQVLNMPTRDLGAAAARKYDIEAWMPGKGVYGEVTSVSNCTDYQARRLRTKFKESKGERGFVHTLNGTAMAVPRIIVALVENNWDPLTNKIKIPEKLARFYGSDEI